jgi:hypothetical protein
MERRALEAEFRALADARDLETLKARAETIAGRGTETVLPVLLAMLDTDDPQLRGGLGQVAAHLDHDLMVTALRSVARSRERPEQARLSALTILERFLHEPVDESLVVGLRDPNAVALHSLHELMREMERSPFAIIEYLNQLTEQPPEVPKMILDAVPLLPPGPHPVTLLRMFAQGQDARLAQAAIEQLGRIRLPEALAALISLAATLPPTLAAMAERSARKLRMSGVTIPAPDSQGWRALMSPVDGAGAQVIWLVNYVDGQAQGTLVGVLSQDPKGIVVCFGSREVPAENLPPVQPVGNIHQAVQSDDVPPVSMLEVPFEVGRHVIRQALELNWASGTPTPLEYRLLNALIWQSPTGDSGSAVVRDGEVSRFANDTSSGAPVYTAALLDHPAFATWFWQTPEVEAGEASHFAARKLGARHSGPARASHIAELAQTGFGPDVRAGYRRRLQNMAQWLALAGQPETAALAQVAAEEVVAVPPAESPFVRRLIGIGLDVAALSSLGKPNLKRAK